MAARHHPVACTARALAALLLVLQAAGSSAAPAPAAYLSDAEALLALKATFRNGDEVLTTWQPGTDACAWKGVTCDTSRTVIILELVGLGLVGAAPQPDGWPLPASLQELLFAEIPGVTGPIPPGWRLPDTLTAMYSQGLPYGGSLSADWILPDSLKYLNFGRCNLSGPLPEGWPLPANLTGVTFSNNSFTGTIPTSLTTLPNLQLIDLEFNQLTGSIPAEWSFGPQFELIGLIAANNNLSGTIPAWPDHPRAQLVVQPGNPGLCGTVPSTPVVIRYANNNRELDRITELPPCPGDESSSGDGNAGAIVGGVVGGVAAVALVAAGAAWFVARRRHMKRPPESDGEKGDAGSLVSKSSRHVPSGTVPPPFNPFAAGPKLRSRTSPKPSSGTDGTADASSRTLSINEAAYMLAANAGSPASGGRPEDSLTLAAKLEVLLREPPAWMVDPHRVTLEQGLDGRLVLLGRGSYGHVYRGWLKAHSPLSPASSGPSEVTSSPSNGAAANDGSRGAGDSRKAESPVAATPVALKVMDAGDVNAFLKEVSVMQRLADCPQVVSFLGACAVGHQLAVVMELIEGGDLRAALSSERAASLSWHRHGRQVALDIASGLAHLHAHSVMHRDLKSKNVLLTRGWRAKLADVGTAALHSATFLSAGSSMFGGTLAWAAPELLLAAPCTNKIDVYSLGVVLWELATREVPRRGFVQPPAPSDDCPQGLCCLIGECLQQDPAARPTAQQALERLQAL